MDSTGLGLSLTSSPTKFLLVNSRGSQDEVYRYFFCIVACMLATSLDNFDGAAP